MWNGLEVVTVQRELREGEWVRSSNILERFERGRMG